MLPNRSSAIRALSAIGFLCSFLLVTSTSSFALPTAELEPNDFNSSSNPLPRSLSGRGQILSGAEYDGWVIPNVQQGDLYYVLLSAITDSGDPVLSLFETSDISVGTELATYFNDDGGPPSSAFDDSLIAGALAKRTGAAVLRVDGFGSSSLDPYEVFQIVVSPNEVLNEVEPNNSAATAMPIASPAILANGSTDDDFYSFHANIGDRIVVMIDQNPGRPDPATIFQANIQVLMPDGVTDVTTVVPGTFYDPTETGGEAQALGALPAPTSGTYFLRITKAEGEDGDYRFVVLVEGDTPVSGACCFNDSCSLTSIGNCRGAFAGAGTSCEGDSDGDGIENDCDNCQQVANLSQEDEDLDQVGNSCDSCSADPTKVLPGACGCGTRDTDTDGDGTADCNDQCFADSSKVSAGSCGCGVPDTDANSNGVADCRAGSDVKTSIQALLTALQGVKPNKPTSGKKLREIRLLRDQIRSVMTLSGAQISVSEAGFDLSKQVNRLLRAAAAAVKGTEQSRASSRRAALKVGEKLLSVIND